MEEKQTQTQFDYDYLYRGFQNRAGGAAQPEPETSQNERQPQYAQSSARSVNGSRQDPELERRLQKELEEQLRALGQTVGDGLRAGFDGKGQQLGDQAAKFGSAVWDMMHYSFGVVADELRKAADDVRSERDSRAGFAEVRSQQAPQPKPSDALLRSARKRFGVGLAQTIPGGVIGGGLLIGCAVCAVLALMMLVNGESASATEMFLITALLATIGVPFDVLTGCGVRNLKISKRLKAYAAIIGTRTVVSLEALAEAVQKPLHKTRRDIKFLLGKGWLTGWLDAEQDLLYLSAEEWHAARNRREETAAQSEQQPQPEQDAEIAVDPAAIHRFVQVLDTEQKLMGDPLASEELTKMQQTSRVIAEWVQAHPESAPKARRFVSYYIPTTLKLLHTYNEMQHQPGDNAESIRRDIGGILHTLNLAFENLYNSMLSDVAMDVSSEIAALQGMLAQDGLSAQQNDPFGV